MIKKVKFSLLGLNVRDFVCPKLKLTEIFRKLFFVFTSGLKPLGHKPRGFQGN